MYYPTIDIIHSFNIGYSFQPFFNIVQVGAGGNGGYLAQRLSKLLYALNSNRTLNFSYKITDGDSVEEGNLQRQPFIEQDLDSPKAEILAKRYSNAYQIPIYYKNDYIFSVDDVHQLFDQEYSLNRQLYILVGCVDNNATRQIMHEYFNRCRNIVYIDSGIDAVDVNGSKESGYSGQVVCGVRLKDKELLSPVGGIYPDILADKESHLPTQACGEQMVYYPQRMQTNEMAAIIMSGYLNTILSDNEIVSHYTNFNARNNLVSPNYIKKGQLAI
ncbi:ThiF family adenylyltransferase [Virgibacillus salexigens]|uniref:PRTRC system ThiF family protein n=1 Tax=Virgibacillus massiliensis TaxID=1462526 RepID=A0A024QH32_9BACI|nr:ThiF family adenylyltransferase [Virgibacillus massiliensis]CDQ41873.1 PRTRC system ThiF family protein [Virgibacillus massiliensis]